MIFLQNYLPLSWWICQHLKKKCEREKKYREREREESLVDRQRKRDRDKGKDEETARDKKLYINATMPS